jgi:hypothetical protein
VASDLANGRLSNPDRVTLPVQLWLVWRRFGVLPGNLLEYPRRVVDDLIEFDEMMQQAMTPRVQDADVEVPPDRG